MRRWAATFSGDNHRNGTLRASLLLKRGSMIQHRLGVRRSGPRASWGRAMRRERGPATFRRRYAGVFLNRGRARRTQTESAGASRGASRNTTLSKEELDTQLDQYMSRTKHALDQDLVAYRQSGGAS
ncbi:chromatin target of PRMT1 protein-like [Tigriopus californicus]|nr:chromatin target of PRMT1 protein-like [Tigriopus californicus]